jgi:Icc-related predicted phosphoesterase
MNKRILVISDLHIPYHREDSFEFLKEIKKEYKPDTIVNIGDEIDCHALSFHDHNPDLASAGHELVRAKDFIKELESIFPEMTLLDSNHSSLVYRRAIKSGIPRGYLKEYNEFLNVKKWNWVDNLTLSLPNKQRCFFTHGISADVTKVSQINGMSCVQGHSHSKFKIEYWANPDALFFAMQVGCLIQQTNMAFTYSKNFKTKFIMGCGMIVDSTPRLMPMVLNKEGKWIGKLV